MKQKNNKMVTKMVKSYGVFSKTQFEILKYLANFLTIPEIAEKRKTSRTAVYKVINKLIKKEAIRKIGKAYEVTKSGKEGLQNLIEFKNKIRLHNLSIKVKILDGPRNWELKRSKIAKIRVLSKNVDLKNSSYQIHAFSNIKLKTTTKSIIFNLPSTYGNNPSEALRKAMEIFWNNISKAERLFNVVLIKDRKINIEIISNHYARLNDDLAKAYKKEGNKLYIRDENEKVWLIADYSFNTDETETIDTIRGHEDMEDVMSPFLNDMRKNPTTFKEVRETIVEQGKVMEGIQGNQLIFDKNMKSHLKVLKEIGGAVRQLTKAVQRKNIKENNLNQRTLEEFK